MIQHFPKWLPIEPLFFLIPVNILQSSCLRHALWKHCLCQFGDQNHTGFTRKLLPSWSSNKRPIINYVLLLLPYTVRYLLFSVDIYQSKFMPFSFVILRLCFIPLGPLGSQGHRKALKLQVDPVCYHCLCLIFLPYSSVSSPIFSPFHEALWPWPSNCDVFIPQPPDSSTQSALVGPRWLSCHPYLAF